MHYRGYLLLQNFDSLLKTGLGINSTDGLEIYVIAIWFGGVVKSIRFVRCGFQFAVFADWPGCVLVVTTSSTTPR